MNTDKRLPAPFKIGTKLRYVGRSRWSTQDGRLILEYGMVGEIIEAHEGYDVEIVDIGGANAYMGPIYGWSVVRIGAGVRHITSEPDSINEWEVIL